MYCFLSLCDVAVMVNDEIRCLFCVLVGCHGNGHWMKKTFIVSLMTFDIGKFEESDDDMKKKNNGF